MMKIVIPSYKRPGECYSAKYLKKGIICCAEKERGEYEKNNKNRVITHPDELIGQGMGVIRNWMLDNVKGEEVLMMDDDIKQMGYYEESELYVMKEEDVYRFIEDGFRMCRELGSVLWGVNLLEDKMAYREYSPFSLNSVILGTFMGIIKNGIRFDESLGLKEDYDYSLQVLNEYRKVLRFNKYHYRCKHIVGKGGCASYRTKRREKRNKDRFLRKWGSDIVEFKDGDLNPIVNVPIKGI